MNKLNNMYSMNKIKNVIGIVAVGVLVVGGIAILSSKPKTTSPAPVVINNEPAPVVIKDTPKPVVNTPTTYSLTDLAKHNSEASCWTAIGGEVYDLTAWIKQHPGGDRAILSICGADGTRAFTGQHGNNRQANGVLTQFKIGGLTN